MHPSKVLSDERADDAALTPIVVSEVIADALVLGHSLQKHHTTRAGEGGTHPFIQKQTNRHRHTEIHT